MLKYSVVSYPFHASPFLKIHFGSFQHFLAVSFNAYISELYMMIFLMLVLFSSLCSIMFFYLFIYFHVFFFKQILTGKSVLTFWSTWPFVYVSIISLLIYIIVCLNILLFVTLSMLPLIQKSISEASSSFVTVSFNCYISALYTITFLMMVL